MCDILQPSFDMSVASPSSGTPVPYYRHGNTSIDSHLERTLTKQSINESGNFALILYLFPCIDSWTETLMDLISQGIAEGREKGKVGIFLVVRKKMTYKLCD